MLADVYEGQKSGQEEPIDPPLLFEPRGRLDAWAYTSVAPGRPATEGEIAVMAFEVSLTNTTQPSASRLQPYVAKYSLGRFMEENQRHTSARTFAPRTGQALSSAGSTF